MKEQVKKIGEFLHGNESWTYIAVLLFIAYAICGVNNDQEVFYFFRWTLLLLLIYSPVLFFSRYEVELKSNYGGWKMLGMWFLAYLIIPLFLFIVLSKTPISLALDPWLNYKFIKDADEVFFFTVLACPIAYILLKFSRERKAFGSKILKFGKITFFSVSVIFVLLISLILPIISNDFQAFMANNSTATSILKYFVYVPQIFLIYFAHYIFYYINHYVLFLQVFEKKGIVYYLLGLVGMILLLSPILNMLIVLFPVVHEIKIHSVAVGRPLLDSINYIYPILVTLVSLPVIILIEWNRKEMKLKELQKQKSDAELSMLKQQINPHFFFNTLNNLYALSLAKSDEAPSTILKLSKLMRFVIYNGQKELVSLEEEVDYINDYIDLQQIRLKQNVDIQFDIKIENPTLQIPPLLFIILIENAFKHGISSSEKDGFIHILLETTENTLIFKCENSVDMESIKVSEKGIGIENLKKRLAIHFSDRYNLKIEESDIKYSAELTLDL